MDKMGRSEVSSLCVLGKPYGRTTQRLADNKTTCTHEHQDEKHYNKGTATSNV